MKSMLLTELAILVHFKPVGIILLVFLSVVIPLLALGTSQSYLHSHIRHLLTKIMPHVSLGHCLIPCLPHTAPCCAPTVYRVVRLYFRLQKNGAKNNASQRGKIIIHHSFPVVKCFLQIWSIYFIPKPLRAPVLLKYRNKTPPRRPKYIDILIKCDIIISGASDKTIRAVVFPYPYTACLQVNT